MAGIAGVIEQGIYFALGCIVTALLALAFAPLFWRRALRLTRQRLQLQVPLSMREILADRDGLRAQFAVDRLRIEREMDRLRDTKAADIAAIGRRDAAVLAATTTIDDLRTRAASQEDTINQVSRALADGRAEMAILRTAIDDATARLAVADRTIEAAAVERRDLEEGIVTQRTTIAGLETRAMGLEMRLVDAQRVESPREKSLADSMRGRLESAMAQAQRHEASALSLRRELDEARARIRHLEAGEHALPDGAEDDGLRASIHALGLAVATMTRAQRDPIGEPPPRASDAPAEAAGRA